MTYRIGLLLCAAAFAQAQIGSTVTGKVVNAANGRGVVRAYVVLRGVETYICQTDAEGRFSVANVADGHYQAEAARPGFQLKPPERAAAGRYLPELTVAAGQPPAPLELHLTPLGMLAGRVVDEAGTAVANANVEVMQYRYTGATRTLRTVERRASDDRGEYFFSDLAPGRYYVRASNLNHEPPLSGGIENRGPGRTRIYAPGYYGGTRDAIHAAMLEVAPGAELDSVDIQVHHVFIYAIRGLAPAGSAQQIVRPAGEPGFAYAQRMYGENREGFEIDGIPPGLYPLRVSRPRQAGIFAFRRVEVRDQDIEGLDMRNATGREVQGTVEWAGAAAAPLNSLTVILQPETPGSGTEAQVSANADGSFSLIGQPDACYLRVQAPAGTYLKAVRLGDRELAGHRFNPGSDSGRLTLVMADDVGKVEGTVRDGAGSPARQVAVSLIPDQSLPYWADLYQTGLTDESGRFSFRDVPPGAYRVYAWTDVEAGAPADPAFRKPFEGQGTPLTIAPRATATTTLRAIDPTPR